MITQINIPKRWILPVYLPLTKDYSHRYEIYYGGAGSGKSVFVAQKLIIKALENKRKILVCRKVGTTLRDSVFEQVKVLLAQIQILQYCTVNSTFLTIELPNGSLFLFKGLDDREKIKSITGLTDIWIEEATEISADDFDQLNIRIRAKVKSSQIFLSYNPCSKVNWCYKRWHAVEPDDNTLITWTTYKDNPMLPASYIAALEKMMTANPTYYKIYALGEFCSLGKLVYPSYEIAALPEGAGDICVGLDFGYATDPTALIVSYVDDSAKTLYIAREYVHKGLTNPDIAELVKAAGLAKERIIGDSAEPKSIEELKRLGLSNIKASTKGPGSITQGIQKVQQYRLIVNPSCVETIKELQNYEYIKDKTTQEYTNEPIDAFNHCLDALRYSLQVQNYRLQSINKSAFGL